MIALNIRAIIMNLDRGKWMTPIKLTSSPKGVLESKRLGGVASNLFLFSVFIFKMKQNIFKTPCAGLAIKISTEVNHFFCNL